jgi:hypothetical protein
MLFSLSTYSSSSPSLSEIKLMIFGASASRNKTKENGKKENTQGKREGRGVHLSVRITVSAPLDCRCTTETMHQIRHLSRKSPKGNQASLYLSHFSFQPVEENDMNLQGGYREVLMMKTEIYKYG